MYNPSIPPIIAMSVWRNNKNSLSVLCGIENNDVRNRFLDNRKPWSKTCIEVFGPETFAKTFGFDPETVTAGKEAPIELGVNLSELSNSNYGIQVVETTSLAEAVALRIVSLEEGKPVVYESNYKRDRNGDRMLHNGKAIYRKTQLCDPGTSDLVLEKEAKLNAITENVPASVSVESEQD
jgi:hypothetical protein